MIHEFTFNGIAVTIDTETAKVSFVENGFNSTKTVWQNRTFIVDDFSQEISATFTTWKEDSSGMIISGTHGSMTTLNKNKPNQIGIGYYDFFNSLSTGTESIGMIAKLARMNNLLENLKSVFGEACPCFNPYNNWEFYHPIQLLILFANNTITAAVMNPYTNGIYEYSLDAISWDLSNQFTISENGKYDIWVRSTTELVPKKSTIYVTGVVLEDVENMELGNE